MKKILLSILVSTGLFNSSLATDYFVVNPADSGPNTLRDHIANSIAGDVIYFDVVDTIKLTTGVINIDHNLTIIGTGFPVISGENLSRIFTLGSGNTLDIEDVTFINGTVGSGNGGGAVYLAGNNVTMKRCNFYNNSCTNATNLWGGGALSIGSGAVSLEECHFEGNIASGSAAGGAINHHSGLTLIKCTVNNNHASGGAWKYGGGINSAAAITVKYSTISGNTITTSGTAYGAGIAKASSNGAMIIQNSTITQNEILSGTDWGGGLFTWGTVSITSNIIAENLNASAGYSDIKSNTSTASGGYNVITQVVSGFNLVSTDIQASPLLGNFANHGGATPSFAIGCNSPAYNAGNDVTAELTDQRGVNSITYGQRDIGSYEYNGALPTPTINVNHVSCFGGNDGSASIASGSLGSTYSWSTGDVGLSISGLIADEYVVMETLSNGCSGTDTFDITEPLAISATITPMNTTCSYTNDGSITISPSGGSGTGYTFDWDNDGTGDYDDSQNLTNLSAGNYNLVIKDGIGCLSQNMSANVNSPTAPSYSLTLTDPLCNGESNGSIVIVGIGGTSPYTYSIDNINFTSSNSFTGLSAGTYFTVIKDANGCSGGGNRTLNDPALVTNSSVAQNISCFGDDDGLISITGSGGSGTLLYSIDGSSYQAASGFSNLGPNTYDTYVRDANGCLAISSATVVEPSQLVVSGVVIDDSGSSDGSIDVSVTGGSVGYTYLWDDIGNSTSQDLGNLSGGTYTITVTDGASCQESKAFTVAGGVTGLISMGQSELTIFPNPFTSELNICSGIEINGTIEIMDLTGKSHYKKVVSGMNLSLVPNLSTGVYLIVVTNNGNRSISRLIKE